MRVLYLGEGSSKGPAGYLISVMKNANIPYLHFPPSKLFEAPSSYSELAKFDVIILSDAESKHLGKKRMASMKMFVEKGGGLGMIGGWASFTGSSGNYRNTPIEEILPVRCEPFDDRVNYSNGLKVIKKTDHPILHGLLWNDSPTICGYNKVIPKDDFEILLTSKAIESSGCDIVEAVRLSQEEHPLLVVGNYKKGNTLAFTTDAAPHWAGGMLDWGTERVKVGNYELGNNYLKFFSNLINWLSKT
jgi:uncharacterized membrane protein